MNNEGLGANTADRSKQSSNAGGSAVLEVNFGKTRPKRNRYALRYRCLLCGKIIEHEEIGPIEMTGEEAITMATVFGNSGLVRENKLDESKKITFYYSIAHNCSGNEKDIGAAVFAGFRRINDEERTTE